MFIKRIVSFFLLFLIIGSAIVFSQEMVPVADHHLHIRSEASSSALVTLQKEMTGTEIPQLDPTGSDQIIEMLDAAKIEYGTLLSLAYFFGAPDVNFSDEYEKVKQENNYVSDEAANYPERLVGFCSVNPLADYAKDEIKRCKDLPQMTGLKLHLANSDIDLRNDKHVEALASIFEAAYELKMPVLIHLFTRNPDYGKKDASIFVNEILSVVPNLPVQIAHFGGAGIYNETTRELIDYFATASSGKPSLLDDDVVFDLSATVANPEVALARGDTTRAEEIEKLNAEFAKKIEMFDADRLIFGTDWIAVSRKPADYADLFISLPFDRSALRTIFENKAPYFKSNEKR